MMNVLAVEDFTIAARAAASLGRPSGEITEQRARADRVVRAIHERLTRPDGVLIDGLEPNGQPSTHASQQANAWALAMGVVPAADQAAVANHVVSLGNAMGVVYFRVLLDALHRAGRDQALVDALTDPTRPGYAQILSRGATFTWESWNAPDVGDSESHGWGATVLAVLQDDLLGARVDQPGASHLSVRVPETTVRRASGVVATQRGPVPTAWTRTASGEVTLALRVPANVTATVELPATSVAQLTDGRVGLRDDPGVRKVVVRSGTAIITIGSGWYRFASH
jgi:alpha-L-rhamnosidase